MLGDYFFAGVKFEWGLLHGIWWYGGMLQEYRVHIPGLEERGTMLGDFFFVGVEFGWGWHGIRWHGRMAEEYRVHFCECP